MIPQGLLPTEEPAKEPQQARKTLRNLLPFWRQWNGYVETDNAVKRAGKALEPFEEACGAER
jgi:hypothetical protein